MAAPYEGMYGKLKFPPFKFMEYPKVMYDGGVAVGHVNSRTEELEFLAERGQRSTENVTLDVSNERDELAKSNSDLQAQVAELTAKLHELIAVQAAGKVGVAGQIKPAGNPTASAPTPAVKPVAPGTPLSKEFPPNVGGDKPIVAAADGTAPLSSGGNKMD
jgi:hypothetical protein